MPQWGDGPPPEMALFAPPRSVRNRKPLSEYLYPRDDRGAVVSDLRRPASDHTVRLHRSLAERLPWHDVSDDERARRGLIAQHHGPIANRRPGAMNPVSWDTARWDFIAGDAPTTVNPSLWRQAVLNGIHGLFEIRDGVYQVRGYDTAVVSFIATDSGWLVIDPLTTEETAAVAKKLVDDHLGVRDVVAVVYTHSHIDHYGGILGIVDRPRIDDGSCLVIAPDGFLHAAVEENVVAQAAMGRRATWQYGMLLPADSRGHVDQGLSKAVPFGTSTLIAPTHVVTSTGERLTVDGLDVEFHLAPDTEAPAEMHLWFPALRALCIAENCTGTMHNVLTLRGALIRDSLAWTRSLDEAIVRYGQDLDVLFASHGWPYWGREDALTHLRHHRDLYRWIHDEAMRLANLGYTPDEIAAAVDMPPELWNDWTCHGYYGTLSHNVRAVYQRHFGFYDGHPASLHPYPPEEAGRRYVDFMGGIDAVIAKAQQSFDSGDYRWVVQVMRHAVFTDPTNSTARALQADACEQLGYQAESGPWRDIYLTAAQELRAGTPTMFAPSRPSPETIGAMTLTQVFDYLAVRLDGPAAVAIGHHVWHWTLSDTGESVSLELSNGVLHSRLGDPIDHVTASLTSTRRTLDRLAGSDLPLTSAIESGDVSFQGSSEEIIALWSHLATFGMFFPIIEP